MSSDPAADAPTETEVAELLAIPLHMLSRHWGDVVGMEHSRWQMRTFGLFLLLFLVLVTIFFILGASFTDGPALDRLEAIGNAYNSGKVDLYASLAGLWEIWTGPDGGEVQSCTILTTDANDLMAPIHNRMPVILEEADWAEWLGSGADDPPARLAQLQHLFRPYDGKKMKLRPVSTYVNSPRNEGEQCIAPVAA